MKVERFPGNPIIKPNMDGRIGNNINGPSLIQVPDWLENPLGKYYLYFAHHRGTYIRLAYADRLEGPWSVYSPGVLELEESYFDTHIASPDVHVDNDRQEIRMYYHGCCLPPPPPHHQCTRVALSKDGIHFVSRAEMLSGAYWRAFQWDGHFYVLTMPGKFLRSLDGLGDFEEGPTLFTPDMRHSAVRLCGNTLYVFYSNVGDCPECILLSTIELTSDWSEWKASEPIIVMEPETDYEGVDLPLAPSVRGWAPERVRQLRDPAIFEEDGETHLLYSVAGENGIAIARLSDL